MTHDEKDFVQGFAWSAAHISEYVRLYAPHKDRAAVIFRDRGYTDKDSTNKYLLGIYAGFAVSFGH